MKNEEYKKSRSETLKIFKKQEKALKAIQEKTATYITSEAFKFAKENKEVFQFRLSQLGIIEKEISSIMKDWEKEYKKLLDDNFTEAIELQKAPRIREIKKNIDRKTRQNIAIKALNFLDNAIISDAFNKVIHADDVNLAGRIWLLRNGQKNDIIERVALGAVRGESIFSVGKDLTKYLQEGEGSTKALRVARNELKNISNDSSRRYFQQLRKETGLNYVQIYNANLDKRVRPAHRDADGSYILDSFHQGRARAWIKDRKHISRKKADKLFKEILCRCWTVEEEVII